LSSGSRIGTRHRELALAMPAAQRLTVFFRVTRARCLLDRYQKIEQSMPIAVETEPILNRRYSPLNSRVQIFDRSRGRFFVVRRKNLRLKFNVLPWLRTIQWE
jgi:hypothetical protein